MDLDEHFNPLNHRLDLVLKPLFGDLAEAMHIAAEEKSKLKKEAHQKREKERRRKEFEKLKSEFES